MKPPVVPANTPEEIEFPDEEFLLEQLSGVGEKGIAHPPIRIPIKTHLRDVFLKTNPWYDRKLSGTIDQLDREKKQKVDTLDWAQRQFFVSSVFDQDKLHFVTGTMRDEENASGTSGKYKHGRDYDHFPSLKAGIFANTLVPKDKDEKEYSRATRQQNDETGTNGKSRERPKSDISRTQSLPVLGSSRLSPTEQNAAKSTSSPRLTKRASLPNIKPKMFTRNSNPIMRQKGIGKPTSGNYKSMDDLDALREVRPETTVSLPNISSKSGNVHHRSIKDKGHMLVAPLLEAQPNEDIGRDPESDGIHSIDSKDELCDDKIIHRLFCTLPDHLKEIASVKSNEINTKIRKEMIAETKKKCNGDALRDKRWKALEQTLRELNED